MSKSFLCITFILITAALCNNYIMAQSKINTAFETLHKKEDIGHNIYIEKRHSRTKKLQKREWIVKCTHKSVLTSFWEAMKKDIPNATTYSEINNRIYSLKFDYLNTHTSYIIIYNSGVWTIHRKDTFSEGD